MPRYEKSKSMSVAMLRSEGIVPQIDATGDMEWVPVRRASISEVHLDELPESTRQVYDLRKLSPCRRSLKRVPAMLSTLAVELLVAFVIAQYAASNIFHRYPLLLSFQPVISALSGNIGLQASSINTRELALGLIGEKGNMCASVRRELVSSFYLTLKVSLLMGLISFFWYLPPEEHTTEGSIIFGVAISVGMLASGFSAAFTGGLAPVLFTRLGFDPTSLAGPLETAIQDVAGGTLLLMFSAWFLSNFGDYGSACPGGDLPGCVHTCQLSPVNTSAATALFNQTCLDTCLDLDSQGIC